MVVLKKVKASSLNEVIVATVIIVLVFGIAVATLNNILMNTANKNTSSIDNRINELIYSYRNEKLKLPYREESEDVSIDITEVLEGENRSIQFNILNKRNKKKIERKVFSNE